MNSEQIERYSRAAQLFGKAMEYTPVEMYEAIGSPLPSRIARGATVVATRELPGVTPSDDIGNLLHYGIDQVADALNFDLKTQPSLEAARNLIVHENTIKTIGFLARLTHEEMNDQIQAAMDELHRSRLEAYKAPGFTPASYLSLPRNHYRSSSQASRGCPAAKRNGSTEHMRIFDQFTVWAGLLSLRALAHHGIPERLSLATIDAATEERLFAMPSIQKEQDDTPRGSQIE